MKKIITQIDEKDFEAIYQLEIKSHRFPWNKETLLSMFDSHYLGYQLVIEGKLVGYCFIQKVLDEATILNIVIDAPYRNAGYGKFLLQNIIDSMRIEGCSIVFLEVRASNIAAISVYNFLGFHQIDIRKGYYPDENGREDAIIMGLMI